MKKKTVLLLGIISMLTLCGCNYDMIDTHYQFDKAYIKTPYDEVIVVDVQIWADSEGEQLTITSTDGTRYLVNSMNVMMVEGEK